MTACPNSADGQHHSDSYFEDREDGYYTCVCVHCGKTFTAHASDLSAAYDDYVTTLPGPTYDSTGRYSIYARTYQPGETFVPLNDKRITPYGYSLVTSTETTYKNGVLLSYNSSSEAVMFPFYFTVPVDGLYYIQFSNVRVSSGCGGIRKNTVSGSSFFIPQGSIKYETVSPGVTRTQDSYFFEAGNWYYFYDKFPRLEPADSSYHETVYGPVCLIPAVSLPGAGNNVYTTTTRPGSLVGLYGDINGSAFSGNSSTIVNETNNTYYNPATGTTVPITDWSYDYSDRSYTLTLEGGKTSSVTYGDESISITETTINESGDTVTNNYTIYYLIDGSGSETPIDPPSACDHAWTETSTTPATCTVPGSKLSTCSKCQQTRTETIPALGHDWQVKQTVTTQYDDTGQLVQEGYTIYECSRCQEQYKTASGTSPPVNPPDASGDGVFSGIFGLLLDFLGFFFKTFKDFTKSGVKAFLEALQDGTSDIFGLLNPFDWSA